MNRIPDIVCKKIVLFSSALEEMRSIYQKNTGKRISDPQLIIAGLKIAKHLSENPPKDKVVLDLEDYL